jgi:hypothetical protein
MSDTACGRDHRGPADACRRDLARQGVAVDLVNQYALLVCYAIIRGDTNRFGA